MNNISIRAAISGAFLFLCFLTMPAWVSAAVELGNLVGVVSGNDSESAILTDFGLDVELLAKVEIPALSSSGLSICTSSKIVGPFAA